MLTPDEEVPLPPARDSIDTALARTDVAEGLARIELELGHATKTTGRPGADPVTENARYSRESRHGPLIRRAIQGR